MRYMIGLVFLVFSAAASAESELGDAQTQLTQLAQQCKNNPVACSELAGRGDFQLLFVLGQMYELGDGVEIDSESAAEYYRKAAAHSAEKARFELMKSYFVETLSEEEYQQGKAWLARNADGEDLDRYVLRQMVLISTNGVGTSADDIHPWLLVATKSVE